MSDEFDWINRDRGVLTERDREILVGEAGEELDQNALNQRFYNIRNRVMNAILDFHILATNLPLPDVRQVFEPAYDWSRERRRLDEEGRTSAHPELAPLLWGWMSLFEFFTYGMYTGGKQETQILMRGLIENGIERGYRQYQFDNLQTYREIDASVAINYGDRMFRDNYLKDVQSSLPNEPSEIAEEVMRLQYERKLPYNVAAHWINELNQTPGLE